MSSSVACRTSCVDVESQSSVHAEVGWSYRWVVPQSVLEQFCKQGAMALWVEERDIAADGMNEVYKLLPAALLDVCFKALHRL